MTCNPFGAHFDRVDICEAYNLIETDYNVNGQLRERPSNIRRNESTAVQLARLGFKTNVDAWALLSDNGRAIYLNLERRYGFA